MMHYAPLSHTCMCEHHAGLPTVHQHLGRQSHLVPHPGGRVWAAGEDSPGGRLRVASELFPILEAEFGLQEKTFPVESCEPHQSRAPAVKDDMHEGQTNA